MLYQGKWRIDPRRINAKDREEIAKKEMAVRLAGELLNTIPIKKNRIDMDLEEWECRFHAYTEDYFKDIVYEVRELASRGVRVDKLMELLLQKKGVLDSQGNKI